MENASKALLIAGGIFFALLMITLLMYGISIVRDYYDAQAEEEAVRELTEFNLGYTNYQRSDVLGYELLSLINKIIDYNQLESSSFNVDSTAGNRALYSPIEIQVIMWDGPKHDIMESDVQMLLTRQISCPPKSDGSVTATGNELELYTNRTYTQNDTIHMFEYNVFDVINDIEMKTEYGGKNGIKNLTNNIGSIYLGNIINYNNGTVTPSWYDMNDIVERYEDLTGISYDSRLSGKTGNDLIDEYEDIIDEIRAIENLEDVKKYYEYTQFQKAEFDCINVEYNQQTGRVGRMVFEFTGIVE